MAIVSKGSGMRFFLLSAAYTRQAVPGLLFVTNALLQLFRKAKSPKQTKVDSTYNTQSVIIHLRGQRKIFMT